MHLLAALERDPWSNNDKRRHTAIAAAASMLQEQLPEVSLPESLDKDIVDRLAVTLATLRVTEPTSQALSYHSNEGRAFLHQTWQSVADPAKGAQDTQLKAISNRLGGDSAFVKTCFHERKEHHLGYVPGRKKRWDATEQWLIEVPLCSIIAWSCVLCIERTTYLHCQVTMLIFRMFTSVATPVVLHGNDVLRTPDASRTQRPTRFICCPCGCGAHELANA